MYVCVTILFWWICFFEKPLASKLFFVFVSYTVYEALYTDVLMLGFTGLPVIFSGLKSFEVFNLYSPGQFEGKSEYLGYHN